MKCLIPLVAAAIALAGCSRSESHSSAAALPGKNQAPVVSAPQDLELGRRIYNFRCYFCHGYSGNAHTVAATFLDPKPADFTSISPVTVTRERMLESVRSGRPGTAMMSFAGVLQPDEIVAVVDFVRHEFMVEKAENTRYHTEANGWFNHERYAAAFPFALGEIPLDTPWEKLTPQQAEGKRLFLASCVSCHVRGRVTNISPGDYPPATNPKESPPVDAMTSATPYHLHDQPPKLEGLTESEKRGETLFQQNCAFCHAADGTARNWIGSFMEPHPRNLTKSAAMDSMTRTRLRNVIRDGLAGTSMPAWKSVLSEQQIEDVIAYVARAFHPLPP
jgi:cytochrome c oxidase cbb3-type subunit 3